MLDALNFETIAPQITVENVSGDNSTLKEITLLYNTCLRSKNAKIFLFLGLSPIRRIYMFYVETSEYADIRKQHITVRYEIRVLSNVYASIRYFFYKDAGVSSTTGEIWDGIAVIMEAGWGRNDFEFNFVKY